MSKKNKKFDPKKEPKKEIEKNIQQEESTESKLAKQISDLQILITNKDKEIADEKAKVEKIKSELEMMANEYKNLISQVEDKANALIKQKFEENELKLKNNIIEAKKYAIEDHAIELINIVSKFSSAVNHPIQDPKIANWLNGFKMYLTMFNNLLNDLHIEEIKVNIGQEFDPKIMECFETIVDKTKNNNTIITVIEPGYKLHDHILKPVLVKVIKNN